MLKLLGNGLGWEILVQNKGKMKVVVGGVKPESKEGGGGEGFWWFLCCFMAFYFDLPWIWSNITTILDNYLPNYQDLWWTCMNLGWTWDEDWERIASLLAIFC